jgi:hypothetical protein
LDFERERLSPPLERQIPIIVYASEISRTVLEEVNETMANVIDYHRHVEHLESRCADDDRD